MTFSRKQLIIAAGVAVITAFAFYLRLTLFRNIGSLWGDEAFALHFGSIPLLKSVPILLYDTHPPLHNILVNGWFHLFGASGAALRALSLALSVIWIPLLFMFGQMLFGPAVAFAATILAAFSPIMIYYGVDGRMYGLLALLATLSMLAMVKMRSAWSWRGWKWVWLIASLALVLTHSTAIAVIAAELIWLFLRHRQFIKEKFISSGFIVVVMVYAAWLLQMLYRRYVQSNGGLEWQLSSQGDSLLNIAESVLWLPASTWEERLGHILFIVAVAATFVIWHREKPHLRASVHTNALFLLLSAGFVLAPFVIVPHVVPRFILAAAPGIIILFTYGLWRLAELTPTSRAQKGLFAFLILATLLLMSTGTSVMIRNRLYNYDHSAEWIANHEKSADKIILGWFGDKIFVDQNYQGALPIELFYPFKDELPLDDRYVRHLSQMVVGEDALDVYAELAGESKRVLFQPAIHLIVKGHPSALAAQREWWEGHDWRVTEEFPYDGMTPPVWLLEKK